MDRSESQSIIHEALLRVREVRDLLEEEVRSDNSVVQEKLGEAIAQLNKLKKPVDTPRFVAPINPPPFFTR